MSAVTLNPSVIVEPPTSLPVEYLSVSSLNLFTRCSSAWARRYLLHETDAPTGKMLRGGATGAALAQHFGLQLERGTGLSTAELLDEYASEWDDRAGREEVDWRTEKPGPLKDAGAAALALYHTQVAPSVTPAGVERGFELTWPDACFALTGYIDLETAGGGIVDFKSTGQRFSPEKAGAELQPTVYLAARRAEGNPATGFDYHTLIATKKPAVEIVPALRTERQLDLLTHRVFSVARAIEWRWRENCWSGTPPDLAWLCRSCSATDCPWRLA